MAPNDRIKKGRTEILAWSQRELAAALDIEQSSLSRWERGVAQPRPHHLRALALLFERPVSWFYEEEEVAA